MRGDIRPKQRAGFLNPRDKEMERLRKELRKAEKDAHALSAELKALLAKCRGESRIESDPEMDHSWESPAHSLEMLIHQIDVVLPCTLDRISQQLQENDGRNMPRFDDWNIPCLYGCPSANDFDQNEILGQQSVTFEHYE